MIDTAKLEKTIGRALRDKGVIHSSVKKVNKAPNYWDIRVWYVLTTVDEAKLEIVMAWQVDEFVTVANSPWHNVLGIYDDSVPPIEKRVDNARVTAQLAMRLKWFRRVLDTLNRYGGDSLIFTADYDAFEFGVGKGCIWAALPVAVGKLPF